MTEPYHTDNLVTVHHGDCLQHLRNLPDNSIDSIVTDPPYGLSNTGPGNVADTITAWATGDRTAAPTGKGFMGKSWDAFVPPPAVWDECLRVLKPGGHMLVFAGSRTQDLMGLSIRLAGFEIRDSLAWIYGSGMPKSHDVSKAIDKAAGAEREVVGSKRLGGNAAQSTTEKGGTYATNTDSVGVAAIDVPITAPATPEAVRWSGWGTSLKPAQEPILLARKPLEGTVAGNVLEWGTGALNIDASRVAASDKAKFPSGVVSETEAVFGGGGGMYADRPRPADSCPSGRWPANVLLDPEAAEAMDQQSGVTRDGTAVKRNGVVGGMYSPAAPQGTPDQTYGGGGGASRFFHVFKSEEGTPETKGRFPANVLLDEHAAQEMDRQSGILKSGAHKAGQPRNAQSKSSYTLNDVTTYSDNGSIGGASRFFPVFKYQAKAPKKERPVIEREDGTKVQHPTVKPLALMEWLVTLITPPGGVVLDPFAGSGTTLEAARDKGFRAVGVEADAEHCELIVARLSKGDEGLFAA